MLAPLPDLVLYWTGYQHNWVWFCARGQCAKCEGMFTLRDGIWYRGKSTEENLICDECFERMLKSEGKQTGKATRGRGKRRPRHESCAGRFC